MQGRRLTSIITAARSARESAATDSRNFSPLAIWVVAPFSRSWMHVGTVTKGGEKVAKSTGNLVFVMDLLRDHSPQALRLLILDRPWNQTWDFDEAGFSAAESRLEELWTATSRPGGSDAAVTAACQALLDDLDVPAALDIALDEGGEAARTVAKILALL